MQTMTLLEFIGKLIEISNAEPERKIFIRNNETDYVLDDGNLEVDSNAIYIKIPF